MSLRTLRTVDEEYYDFARRSVNSTILLVVADKGCVHSDKRPSKYLTQAQSVTYFGLKNLLTVGVSTDVWGSYSTMRRKQCRVQIATVSNQYL